jgi:LPS sulfotransferase NodH
LPNPFFMSSEKTNFIILFQGRTGSSYLIDLLNQHPEITAESEMLVRLRKVSGFAENSGILDRFYGAFRLFRDGLPSMKQIKAVKQLYDNPNPPTRVIGFKTKVRDIENLLEMKNVLEPRNVKLIVMNRKNLVKKAISHITAARLNQKTKDKYRKVAWNLYDDKDRLGQQRIEIDEFRRSLKSVIFEHKILQAYAEYLNLDRLELEYSDLLRNRNEWLHQVFDFLGVTWADLESKMLKNTDDDLRKAISNFEELKSHYSGSEYEAMFDEIIGAPVQAG